MVSYCMPHVHVSIHVFIINSIADDDGVDSLDMCSKETENDHLKYVNVIFMNC